jgi:hypothetical protein
MKNKQSLAGMASKGIIVLLAVLVLVLGFVSYLLSSKALISPKSFENEITKVETTSDSTDIDDIEKDLDETDLDDLDAELSDIEAELD